MTGSPAMQALFLGTGSSVGVPMIGCHCAVCLSPDRRNHRTRSSLLVTVGGKNILVDTSPDLRIQALRHGLDRVDAVIYTHAHADHVLGLDELRTFNFIQGGDIPIYAPSRVLDRVRAMVKRRTVTGATIEPTKRVMAVRIIFSRPSVFPVRSGCVF